MKRRTLAVFGLYLLIAVVITWPLLPNLSTALAGFVYGDAYETAHHVWWFTEALRTGQSPFFQSLLAYPAGLTGVTQWADPLHFFPAWLLAFVLPVPAAVNIQTLLTLALNGLAMWAFLAWLLRQPLTPQPPLPRKRGEGETAPLLAQRGGDGGGVWPGEGEAAPLLAQRGEAGGGVWPGEGELQPDLVSPSLRAERGPGGEVTAAAFFGGLVFMLFPAVQGHLGAGHTGLLVQWPLPLFAWALLRLDRAGWRGVLLAAGCFLLGALGHTLQVIYALLPLAALFLLRFAWRREWGAAGRAVAAVLLGAAALALFGLPVFAATLGTGAYADEGGAVRYSADALAVVTPSFFHPLFTGLDYTHRVLGINLDEGAAFLSFSGLLIGLLALWKTPRSRFWWGVALLAWVFSLGPLLKLFDQPVTLPVDGASSGVVLPFAAIMDLPLIRLARTPGRFNFLPGFAWAVVLAYGAHWLAAKVSMRRGRAAVWALTAALSLLIAFEFQVFWPVPLASAEVPAAITALRERDDLRAVFDVPWGNLVTAKTGLFLQTAHGHPLIAGQVTRRTPVSPALLNMLQDTLDPARLRAAGADIIIVHHAEDDGTLDQRARAQLGTPLYEDARFSVYEVPQTETVPGVLTAGFRGGELTDRAEIYVYAPESGWWSWAARLEADGRAVSLWVDDQLIGRWQVGESITASAPFLLGAGYHTLTLAVEPPCPAHIPAGQACRAVTVSDLALEPLAGLHPSVSGGFRAPGEAGLSVSLTAALPQSASAGAELRVPLVWTTATDRAETDIRFVHVLGSDGVPVAQLDSTLGALAAGETRAEWVTVPLPADLAPGEYRVVAGWYTYPAITRFCLVENDACAGQEIELGVLRVE